jgi:hypothetical protein
MHRFGEHGLADEVARRPVVIARIVLASSSIPGIRAFSSLELVPMRRTQRHPCGPSSRRERRALEAEEEQFA